MSFKNQISLRNLLIFTAFLATLIGMISNWPKEEASGFNEHESRRLESACREVGLPVEGTNELDDCEMLVATLSAKKNTLYHKFRSSRLIDRDADGYLEYRTNDYLGVFALVDGTVKIWNPTTKQFLLAREFKSLSRKELSRRRTRFRTASFVLFCFITILVVQHRNHIHFGVLLLVIVILFGLLVVNLDSVQQPNKARTSMQQSHLAHIF